VNVLLTRRCNRRCPYCFAAARISYAAGGGPDLAADEVISEDAFGEAVAFAVRSRVPVLGVLGGEPSLHPRFLELLSHAWERGLETKVFTNGLWRPRDLEAAAARHARGPVPLRVVLNVNAPAITPAAEQRAQERLLEALGPLCTLSYNVYDAATDLRFLVELVRRHRSGRHIRLGMAQPLAETGSAHLAPAEYPRVVPRLMDLAAACDAADVTLGFDCGFTLCMFTPEQLGVLQLAGSPVVAQCGPAVDVGTDLSVWACFPLATITAPVQLGAFADLDALVRHFEQEFGRLYRAGALDACLDCRFLRRRQCAGGCAAHVYRSAVA
jgi:sulfatase maturation enzyme AslB (radical SAM superfamily)